MDKPNIKPSQNLVLTAILSGGLTIGLSLIYILLCIASLIFRYNCDAGKTDTSTGAEYFWKIIFRVYVLNDECPETITIESLTADSTVLILTALTLGISVVCIAAAIVLITIIRDETKTKFIEWAVYVYIGSCLVSLAVDLTTAAHFGADYSHLTAELGILSHGSPSNYRTEVIRQGAFWLMTIALKGYIPHFFNCVLIILLAVYILDYVNSVKSDEHSIHKLGALNAFDPHRKPQEAWSQNEYNNSPFSRGPHINSAFIEDDTPPDTPRRQEPQRSDYFSNPSFDRSDSWHHSQNANAHTRPFSYLEPVKRPAPTKPPPSPAVESPWRREPSPAVEAPWRRDPSPAAEVPWRREPWQQQPPPHVPAPDYSPPQPRRLKSALKPGYM